MNTIKELRAFCKDTIKTYPQLTGEIEGLLELCLDEIDAGESTDHEINLCYRDIKQLIENENIQYMEQYIKRSYLLDLIKEPKTVKEITETIIKDHNIVKKSWKLKDTKLVFELANINLRSKPRKTKKYESKLQNTPEI